MNVYDNTSQNDVLIKEARKSVKESSNKKEKEGESDDLIPTLQENELNKESPKKFLVDVISEN